MKILIISSEIVVNKYSASVCTAKIIKALSEKHQVDLVTEPMSIFDFSHNVDKIFITDYKIPKTNELNFFEKIILKIFKVNLKKRQRYKAFRRKLREINSSEYDITLGLGGGGFFDPLRATRCVSDKVKRIGFIHDPYPSDIFPKPYQSQSNRLTLKERKKLQNTLDKLDFIAFPSLYLSEWMAKFYYYESKKIKILPHLLPEYSKEEIDRNEDYCKVESFIIEHSLQQNNFILHTGTLLKHRPIHKIIEAFVDLKNDGLVSADTKIVFIGNVNYKLPEYQADSVVIINNRLPLKLINIIAKKSSALMIIEHDGDFSPFLPGKVPEYIALNKPIMHFGPRKSETVRLLSPYTKAKPFSADLNDLTGIKNVILEGGVFVSDNSELINYFKIESFINQFTDLS